VARWCSPLLAALFVIRRKYDLSDLTKSESALASIGISSSRLLKVTGYPLLPHSYASARDILYGQLFSAAGMAWRSSKNKQWILAKLQKAMVKLLTTVLRLPTSK